MRTKRKLREDIKQRIAAQLREKAKLRNASDERALEEASKLVKGTHCSLPCYDACGTTGTLLILPSRTEAEEGPQAAISSRNSGKRIISQDVKVFVRLPPTMQHPTTITGLNAVHTTTGTPSQPGPSPGPSTSDHSGTQFDISEKTERLLASIPEHILGATLASGDDEPDHDSNKENVDPRAMPSASRVTTSTSKRRYGKLAVEQEMERSTNTSRLTASTAGTPLSAPTVVTAIPAVQFIEPTVTQAHGTSAGNPRVFHVATPYPRKTIRRGIEPAGPTTLERLACLPLATTASKIGRLPVGAPIFVPPRASTPTNRKRTIRDTSPHVRDAQRDVSSALKRPQVRSPSPAPSIGTILVYDTEREESLSPQCPTPQLNVDLTGLLQGIPLDVLVRTVAQRLRVQHQAQEERLGMDVESDDEDTVRAYSQPPTDGRAGTPYPEEATGTVPDLVDINSADAADDLEYQNYSGERLPALHAPSHALLAAPMQHPALSSHAQQHTLADFVASQTTDSVDTPSNDPPLQVTPRPPGGFPTVHGGEPGWELANQAKTNIGAWLSKPGGKVLAIVFEHGALDYKVQDQRFAVVAHLKRDVGRVIGASVQVSPPVAVTNPDKLNKAPYAYLLHGFSESRANYLLTCQCLSTPNVNVRFAALDCNLSQLFVSFGHIPECDCDAVRAMAVATMTRGFNFDAIVKLIRDTPGIPATANAEALAQRLITTVHINSSTRNGKGSVPTPIYNLFMSTALMNSDTWPRWQKLLQSFHWTDDDLADVAVRTDIECDYCHGRDHYQYACPFLRVPGWHGPQPTTTRSASTSQMTHHAAGPSKGFHGGRGGGRGGRGGR